MANNNVRGGTLLDVRINGRPYNPTNDSSPNINTVRFDYENEPTGNGEVHTIRKRRFCGVTDLELSVDDADFEALSEIWEAGIEVEVVIQRANESVYGGLLMPEGEAPALSGDGKVTVSFVGREFLKIS